MKPFRKLAALALAAASVPLPTRAQSAATAAPAPADAVKLESYVLSATRTPQDPKLTPSAVTLVPLETVVRAQLPTLMRALEQEAGVIAYNNGGLGSQSTLLLRGASAHQTLFHVDGVRMNDRSAGFQNFLGGAGLAGIDRVEVLRGPQSTLFGSAAMGGVVLVASAPGSGRASGTLSATAGAFDTFGAAASIKGAERALGYSAAVGYVETDNHRPRNRYEAWSGAGRLDYTAAPALRLGATFRAVQSDYQEPGSRLFLSPGMVDFANYLTTAYGEARVGEQVTSRLTLAQHRRDYTFTSRTGVSPIENRREIVDWQNTWDPGRRAQLVAGVNYERSRSTVSGGRSSDRIAAGYASTVLRPAETLTFTAGLRHDDFRSAGAATTGRVGAAWRAAKHTRLRATYGTGFSAPGSDDVYGVPAYGQLPNRALLPERSRGWDAGIDQEFLDGAALASVTYFQNRFRNLFEYQTVNFTTFEGRTVNRARATTEGAEVALAVRASSWLRARASYTYLEAKNDLTRARLTRRPRHTGDLEVQVQPAAAWVLGAGVHIVSARLNGTRPIEDYTATRVFASVAVRHDLLLKLRVENALDESYEEVFGYPAPPRAVHGAVEWRF